MRDSTVRTSLDLKDTSALKAFGILAIVLHNFFHKLPSAPQENEFNFDPERFQRFLDTVIDPHLTIQSLFSFLGHFGVQLFIFLSAYGLALSYWTVPAWGPFVWSRVRKIYPMFCLALLLWLLLMLVKHGPGGVPGFLVETGDDVLLTFLGVVTLAPGYGLPPVGPWWFLPFIVQFYFLWPALAAFSRRFELPGLLALSAICLGITIGFNASLNEQWSINLTETPVGHMPELCLGIACARYGLRVGPASSLVAGGLFTLGNMMELFWPLTFVSALVILVYLYQLTADVWRERQALAWIAAISMPIFFVNGFLRSPFLAAAARFDRWYIHVLLGVCVALFACAVAYLLSKVERRISPQKAAAVLS